MSSLIPVEGNGNFARDPISGAVLNINTADVYQARLSKAARKRAALANDNRIQEISDRMDSLDHKLNLILEKL